MDYGIKGKVAVVTGTGRQGAMGHTIAKTLAGEGVNIACVDVNIEGAEVIAEELRAMGVNAKAYNIDQSEYEQVKEGAAKIAAEMGPVDILVNNAALLRGGGRIQKTTVEDWKNLLRIDLDGPWYWIREVWDSMVEQNWGRIVNISSIAGVQGGFGQANYSAAKAGVIALAKTAALEGARAGIVANTVTLGVVDSAGGRMSESEMMQRIAAQVAMRKLGEPADVATLVAFLVSEQCKYITGQDIHVMGGLDLFTY
ncbi:MAG: SDR family oxidoreductase [Dehalococcoidales bacterium]|nr:MAG: SDR family oxidoreductase [Dehalococcoidales bacterium]